METFENLEKQAENTNISSEGLDLDSEEWSNNACFGYVIKAKKLGYADEEIQKLIHRMYLEMDLTSVEDAKEIYNKSSY